MDRQGDAGPTEDRNKIQHHARTYTANGVIPKRFRWGGTRAGPLTTRSPKGDAGSYKKKNDEGTVVAIQDESIVISDARKGIRAFFTYTGSHSKTIIHGLLTTDGRGMFRQYDEFTKDTFAQALYKFKKICLIMDRASQHRATKIRELVEKTDGLEIIFLPTATPDQHRDVLAGFKRAVLTCLHQPAHSARRSPDTRGTKNRTWSLKISCTGLSETASNHDQRVPCTMPSRDPKIHARFPDVQRMF